MIVAAIVVLPACFDLDFNSHACDSNLTPAQRDPMCPGAGPALDAGDGRSGGSTGAGTTRDGGGTTTGGEMTMGGGDTGSGPATGGRTATGRNAIHRAAMDITSPL